MNTKHIYQKIKGWFDYADIYQEAVRRCPNDGVIVEVGSYMGKSSAFMAVEILNSGKNIEFYCVDTWRREDVSGFMLSGCSLGEFASNVKTVMNVIRPIRLPSVTAARAFDPQCADFVFIDAAHDYRSVKEDIEAWFPIVKDGGILAGHDFTDHWPGVKRAVREKFSQNVVVQGSCWLVAKMQTARTNEVST